MRKVSDHSTRKGLSRNDHIQIVNRYNLSVKRENYYDQFRKRWQAELSQLEIENRNLVSNIEQLSSEQKQYIITAPPWHYYPVCGWPKETLLVQIRSLHKYLQRPIFGRTLCFTFWYWYLSIGTSACFQFDAIITTNGDWPPANSQYLVTIAFNDQLVFKVRCSLNNTVCAKNN